MFTCFALVFERISIVGFDTMFTDEVFIVVLMVPMIFLTC